MSTQANAQLNNGNTTQRTRRKITVSMLIKNSNTPMPNVTRSFLINVIMLLATWTFRSAFNIDLNQILGLHFIKSTQFRPYQIITHMFMHGGFTHLFFNMFALWMFGRILESVWGPKRFFIYYFVSGLGAVFLHTLVNYLHFVVMFWVFFGYIGFNNYIESFHFYFHFFQNHYYINASTSGQGA